MDILTLLMWFTFKHCPWQNLSFL